MYAAYFLCSSYLNDPCTLKQHFTVQTHCMPFSQFIYINEMRASLKEVCLHHCADAPPSWRAPPQEDQARRCTWPCARHDPSCSEPAGGTHSWLNLKHQYVTFVRSLCQTDCIYIDWRLSCISRKGRTGMTILIACNVDRNCHMCYI